MRVYGSAMKVKNILLVITVCFYTGGPSEYKVEDVAGAAESDFVRALLQYTENSGAAW